jgi:small-conductance mechanosensitive channel
LELIELWLNKPFFNNSFGEYGIALGTLVGLVLVFVLSRRLFVSNFGKWAAKTPSDFDDFLVNLLSTVGAPIFIITALYISTLPLELHPRLRAVIFNAFVIAWTVQAVWMTQRIIRYGIGRACRRAHPEDPFAETLAANITNILRWALWALAAVFILDNLGINISTLLAGLGIGGIAVAIASQAILADLFSALSIFVDKPFAVGDFIVVENFMGTVEYIGLKTTRLRSLDGEQLVLANSDLTKSRIRNYKRMQMRRVVFKVGVIYETPTEKLRKIPQIVKNIFSTLKDVRLDRVHFLNFGDFSLLYEVVYYVLSADYNLYMDKQQEINLALKDVFEQEEIEWARYQPIDRQKIQ